MIITPAATKFIQDESSFMSDPALILINFDKQSCCGVKERVEPLLTDAGILEIRKDLKKFPLKELSMDLYYPIEMNHLIEQGKIDVMGVKRHQKLILVHPENEEESCEI